MSSTPDLAVRRNPDRQVHDPDLLAAILDEALVAHVGYVRDGQPVVIPTLCVRWDEELVLHGSPAAGHLRAARRGEPLCVTITLLDGLVLARSGMHHSVNYRSVVVLGTARRITGEEKLRALDRVVEAMVPGRTAHLRPMTDREARQTEVVALSLRRSSVKVRSGPPVDEPEDYQLPIWAGVVPIRQTADQPVADPRSMPGLAVPDHVRALAP